MSSLSELTSFVESLGEESEEELTTRQKRVDEYGDAEREYKRLAAKAKIAKTRLDNASSNLQIEADRAANKDEECVLTGKRYQVSGGKRASKVTDTDDDAVLRLLGQKRFNDMAQVGVGQLRSTLTPRELDEVLTEDRIGPRKFSAVRIDD